MFLAKKFIRSALMHYGYRIVPIEQPYRPTPFDAENSAALL